MSVDFDKKFIVDVSMPSEDDGRPPFVSRVEQEIISIAKVPLIPNDTYVSLNDFSEP